MDKESPITHIAGYLSIALFLFIEHPFLKLFLAIFYIVFSLLSGMKVKIMPNLILFSSLILINLLVPQGEVLFELSYIIITKDALFNGIEKSSLLIGLLYLSKNISFSNIKIPGRPGIIIRDAFYYFNQLSSGDRIKPVKILEQIDQKLVELKPPEESLQNDNKPISKTLYFLMGITLITFTLDKFFLTF